MDGWSSGLALGARVGGSREFLAAGAAQLQVTPIFFGPAGELWSRFSQSDHPGTQQDSIPSGTVGRTSPTDNVRAKRAGNDPPFVGHSRAWVQQDVGGCFFAVNGSWGQALPRGPRSLQRAVTGEGAGVCNSVQKSGEG